MRKDKVTIMIADDDLDVRMILSEYLEDQGYEIMTAEDGSEALEKLLINRPNLVILDVMMPELNGWEICKYIKQSDDLKSTKVIMLTAIGHTVNSLTSPIYGADSYLDKPFDLGEIEANIERLLELNLE